MTGLARRQPAIAGNAAAAEIVNIERGRALYENLRWGEQDIRDVVEF